MRGRLVFVLGWGVIATLLAAGAAACGEAIGAEDDILVLPDRTEPDGGGGEDGEAPDASTADTSTTDTGGSVDADAQGPLRVFVSSTMSNSNMPGLAGADLKCTNLAIDAKLGGKWVAWLSAENGPHAIDRITSAGPWSLLTGDVVATKLELTTGTIQHPIDRDEKGAPILAGRVWTGTGPNGRYSTNDCDRWRNGGNGRAGEVSAKDTTWTSAEVRDCGNTFRIYCFEL
jgi:hypothetical protein